MKIGILTQPLHNNYGGLLQCYALQTILKRLGHDAWIVNRDYEKKNTSKWRIFVHYAKQIVKRAMGRKSVRLLDIQKLVYIKKNTSYFVSKYIGPQTEHIRNSAFLRKCHLKHRFEAYIVGSDQVWRPSCSPCITNYFLDFFSPNEKVKRIAYAASFGVDEWEFSKEETKACRELLQNFDAVSVREDSATSLCTKYLNRKDALHVLDPTMLLEKLDYIALVEKEKEPKNSGTLFYYILDESEEKKQVIAEIARKVKSTPFTKLPECRVLSAENLENRLEECVYPTVTAWLRAFIDAEMVVTDSFHGCVFSIIFNKPFWVIGNKERGMARFNSLLSTFDLQERLITSKDLPFDVTKSIDWQKVNNIRRDWQVKSINFLKNNL